MKTFKSRFAEYSGYFFILLFCYASISKIMDFENFQIQVAQSPLLSAYAVWATYGVLIFELIVCFLLIFDRSRFTGLIGAYILMVLFTVYIYFILNYSDFVPCSCGGILEKMDWNTHLIFNVICVIAVVLAIFMTADSHKITRAKISLILVLTAILCAAIMVFLHKMSENILQKDNGFQRRFLQHAIWKEANYDLKLNSYYIAGFSGDTVFLGNYTAPFLVTKITNSPVLIQQPIQLEQTDLNFRSPLLEVIDSITYFYDGTVPVIFAGKTGTKILKEQNTGKTYFRKIRNIDSSHFVISAFHRRNQIQSLGTIAIGNKDSLKLNPDLLKTTGEGFFEPDGQLNYDAYTGKVVYTYYYKNQFIVTDKYLRSAKLYHTIDTVRTPRLGLSVQLDGSRKLNNPLVVNQRSYAYKGVLFIESDRRGKLEKNRGRQSIIIDLYSILEQKYLGSISIPSESEKHQIQFAVHNDSLYMITDSKLTKFRLTRMITQHFISGEAENLNKE
ncbi:putative membrane protein YphA (DoxX/SURF4 family) [Epilithonimonas hungarica]|uniref:MauE/DoxX family redox-associated membrane protein n=1 Tax=Epilithonimonas hungarica TaxID=454006 RepID=UPI00278B2202|nr:MauE/DoxX family redox-associated membrane protein [Epilithonimonas hungarica]MDP9955064.1 putative membrane protein YphA (DoxX/SURF4 family) [Epilithonimonas hungarica]